MAGISSGTNHVKTIKFASDDNVFRGDKMYSEHNYMTVKCALKLLAMGEELNECILEMQPGESFAIDGVFAKDGRSPLVITKSGRLDETDVDSSSFTLRRLRGLAAATLYTKHSNYYSATILTTNDLYAIEPEALGLITKQNLETESNDLLKLYLSAVSGAEYYIQQFDYLPFVCALRKYQMKYISKEMLLQIGNIKNDSGVSMAVLCRRKFKSAKCDFSFGGQFNLELFIKTAPEDVKCLLVKPKLPIIN